MRAFVAALVVVVAAQAHARSGRLVSDGTWIRDALGRVVILRGVNYSGLEFGNFFGAPHGPDESDFAQMATWGVNAVRLPIAWHYLEPAPGRIDVDHLRAQVDPIVAFARRHGMVVVLELHQFLWSPCMRNSILSLRKRGRHLQIGLTSSAERDVYPYTNDQCRELLRQHRTSILEEASVRAAPFVRCSIYVGTLEREECGPATHVQRLTLSAGRRRQSAWSGPAGSPAIGQISS